MFLSSACVERVDDTRGSGGGLSLWHARPSIVSSQNAPAHARTYDRPPMHKRTQVAFFKTIRTEIAKATEFFIGMEQQMGARKRRIRCVLDVCGYVGRVLGRGVCPNGPMARRHGDD